MNGNTEQSTTSNVTRKGSTPVKVYCLPDEKRAIEANAQAANLSASNYLLKVGLGYRVTGVLDLQRIDELARINGDLGRLGGLLKLWLTDDEKLARFSDRQMRTVIEGVLARVLSNQSQMREIMQDVIRRDSFSR